jgi:hypothetical protein
MLEPSIASKSLRRVATVITLVVVVVAATLVYSAYADVSGFMGAASNPNSRVLAIYETQNASGIVLTVNATLSNRGFYPMNIIVACATQSDNVGIRCGNATVNLQPGQTGTLSFAIVVTNMTIASQIANGETVRIPGMVEAGLGSFASITDYVDFGSMIRSGSR